jgi:polyphosphate glucokinase
MDVLVIDVGGSHVKFLASGATGPRRFDSSQDLTPPALVGRVLEAAQHWKFDAVSLAYPGIVGAHGPVKEPGNLGTGWVGFDFAAAFGRPVRVVNDAVMQALGGYEGGRMLFLGLGTGLGSALVSDHVVVPMELGNLPYATGETLGARLGRKGLNTHGRAEWLATVAEVIAALRAAFEADYVLLGGGNARHVDPLPDCTKRAARDGAFTGGFRLWEETIEPHDRRAPLVWRVVR